MAAPSITSVTPATGPVTGGVMCQIVGTNLVDTGNSTVLFGAISATVTYQSTTLILVTSPAAAVSTVGVTVTTSSSGNNTKANCFTYSSSPTVLPVGLGPHPTTPFNFVIETSQYTSSSVDHFAYGVLGTVVHNVGSYESAIKPITDAFFSTYPHHPDNANLPCQRVHGKYLGAGNLLITAEYFHRLWPMTTIEESWSVEVEPMLTQIGPGATWWDGTSATSGPVGTDSDYQIDPDSEFDVNNAVYKTDPRKRGKLTQVKTAHISWRKPIATNPITYCFGLEGCTNSTAYTIPGYTFPIGTLLYMGPSNIKYMGGWWYFDINVKYRPFGWFRERWPRDSGSTPPNKLKATVASLLDVRVPRFPAAEFNVLMSPTY